MNEGTPYTLTVNYNASSSLVGFSIYCGAWIDWNNDGTFDDARERIMTTDVGPAGATTQTGASFTPTVVGTFRMRVIMQTGSNPTNPCTTGGGENGEAKDFKVIVDPVNVNTLEINAANNFTIHPNPSNLNGVYFKFNTLNNKLLTIKLIDLLGKTVEQKVVFAKTTGEQQFIDFNDVTSGIYNIEITDGTSAQRIKLILTQD